MNTLEFKNYEDKSIMGNYTSKFLSHDSVEENNTNVTDIVEQSNLVKECNSITPSTTQRKLMIDPRSITAEICRTPIKVRFYTISTIFFYNFI